MKPTSLLAALAACAMLTGCDAPTPSLISVEPIAGAADTSMDSALLGVWEGQEDKDLVAIIRPADQGAYQIGIWSGGSVTTFAARLFRVKDTEFLDLSPGDDNDFRLPGHAAVRVWVDGASLRWAYLDTDWLKQKTAGLAVHTSGGKMQLFSPTDTVRAFLACYGTDDNAYGNVTTWQRMQ